MKILSAALFSIAFAFSEPKISLFLAVKGSDSSSKNSVMAQSRTSIRELKAPVWSEVPGIGNSTNPQYNQPTLINTNGVSVDGSTLTFDVVGADLAYSRLAVNCKTLESKELQRGDFISQTQVRFTNRFNTTWSHPVSSYLRSVMRYVCSPEFASKIAINRSPSTGVAQTAKSPNCPKDQLPVVVKTSDGQSPSYAGAANAGVNKNGMRSDGSKIDPTTRCIFFVEIQSPPNPYETWLISHGWDDSSEGSLKALAQDVAKQNPNDRVLMLDWSEASINKGDDGANPLGINEKLSRGNYYAATWIRPTAEVAFEYLKRKYQLDPSTAKSTLNMIGHSLGSLMSAEIGRLYKQSNGVGINYLVALDPPSEFNVLEGTPIGSLGGYDLDGRTPAYKDVRKPSATVSVSILLPPLKLTSPFETRTLVPGNVDRPQPFDSVARFSRAFVGKTSFAGNQAFAATAHESFQMDFGDRSDPPSNLGREHGLVVESFTKRIAGEGLAPGFLGLRDRKRHEDIKSNAYPYRVNPLNPADVRYEYTHEGVITISPSNQFSAFHLESRSLGKIVFSSMDNATEDTTYLTLDMNIAGRRGLVAGGSFFPEVNKIFPSLTSINYAPLIR